MTVKTSRIATRAYERAIRFLVQAWPSFRTARTKDIPPGRKDRPAGISFVHPWPSFRTAWTKDIPPRRKDRTAGISFVHPWPSFSNTLNPLAEPRGCKLLELC